jgi:two-component system, chemotaxis family, response regulator WspF
LLSKIRTIGKLISADAQAARQASARPGPSTSFEQLPEVLVAIGASTGGPMALARVFAHWTPPEDCAAVIVQHIDQNFTDSFANWLGDQIGLPITVIDEGTRLARGRIYIAKTNDHLVLDARHRLSYRATPLDYPYRPSVDVFFHCVAKHWQKPAIGVLLTGMGRDGARGLLAMRDAGKTTIAQDHASSAVYGMPRAAADLNAAELILPLDKIGVTLRQRTQRNGG